MKITRHPHRLDLGWNNVFWIRDGQEQSIYRAYVEANGYYFEQYSPQTVSIMTPAQQMLWVENRETMKHSLSPYMRRWLEDNIGQRGPDWYAREEEFDLQFLSVLFRRRKDALRLIRFIGEALREEAE